MSPRNRLDRLLKTGGFPEAYLHPDDAERLKNTRFDIVLEEDFIDVSHTGSLRKLELLIELLRERVGSTLNYSNIAEDLSVSTPTVQSWVQILERLYIIFLVPPYSKSFSRSIRKEPKCFFYDSSAAYEDHEGIRLENLVASTLLKYCHFNEDTTGIKHELRYFRDKEKREVDFIVLVNRKVHSCIEVKTSDDSLHQPLLYVHERIQPVESIQLVKNLDRNLEISGIKILDLALWLDTLDYSKQKIHSYME
jgi:predicted AAA+ superfamily ATPase